MRMARRVGDESGRWRDRGDHVACRGQRRRVVVRPDAIELRFDDPAERPCGRQGERQARADRGCHLADQHAQHRKLPFRDETFSSSSGSPSA
jgi:hypothetical protein